MRVIAGEFKGRKLKTLDDKAVRSTLDRVKEAVFSVLGDELEGRSGFDFFAGFGSLGIEALSRGAKAVTFVEQNFKFRKVIEQNLKTLAIDSSRFSFESEVFKTMELLSGKGQKIDFIFADPPYLQSMAGEDQLLVEACLLRVDEFGLLSDKGVLIMEHLKKVSLPDTLKKIYRYKQKIYGTVSVSFYCNHQL